MCQDYALSGIYKGVPYAIVSDGCSGAEFSEVGSQTLCFAAKAAIESWVDKVDDREGSLSNDFFREEIVAKYIKEEVCKRAEQIIALNSLSQECLQATLLIAFTMAEDLYTFVWGDGVIIIKRSFEIVKQICISDIEYVSNAPFYLFANKDIYEQRVADKRKLYKVTVGDEKEHEVASDADIEIPVYEPCIYKEPLNILVRDNSTISIRSITLCSDGIKSFRDKDMKTSNIWNMAKEFTNYASFCESFVRRCMNFLKKKNIKSGTTHYDDIATATILMEDKHE